MPSSAGCGKNAQGTLQNSPKRFIFIWNRMRGVHKDQEGCKSTLPHSRSLRASPEPAQASSKRTGERQGWNNWEWVLPGNKGNGLPKALTSKRQPRPAA